MSRYVCPICNKRIEDGEDHTEKIKYDSTMRVFHTSCYRAYVKGVSDKKTKQKQESKKETKKPNRKPKAELKEAIGEEEYKEKRSLFSYLRDVLSVEPNPKVYTLVDRYKTQYDCSYKGMEDCLRYLNEVSNKALTGDVVGLIPYYYDEAKKYYENLKKIENSNADSNPVYQEKVVRIQKPKNTRRKEIDF